LREDLRLVQNKPRQRHGASPQAAFTGKHARHPGRPQGVRRIRRGFVPRPVIVSRAAPPAWRGQL